MMFSSGKTSDAPLVKMRSILKEYFNGCGIFFSSVSAFDSVLTPRVSIMHSVFSGFGSFAICTSLFSWFDELSGECGGESSNAFKKFLSA